MCPQVKMELRENPKLQAEMIKHLDKWRPFQVGQRPKSKEVSHHPRTGHQEEAMPSTGFSNTRQGAWHFTGPHTCVWSKPMKSSNTNTWSMPKWQNSSLRPLWLPVAYNTWLPTHPHFTLLYHASPYSLCSTLAGHLVISRVYQATALHSLTQILKELEIKGAGINSSSSNRLISFFS